MFWPYMPKQERENIDLDISKHKGWIFLIGNEWMRVVLSYKGMPMEVLDRTRIQRDWLTWIVHGHVLLYIGRWGEVGWEKTWSEKHLAVTFGTPCPLMSVMRTSIIWLSLFHRSLVISLHVGTKQCSVKPRGLFSLCVIRFMSFMCGILVYTSRCAYRQTDIENDWSSSP